ncbi:hypothetical protein [Aquimarina agarilytica]|uniref:hypothetical protein n=1 Tax=Aquimarina agarilytica TaxID=1087449 RepID=UPI0002883807|nr:hypothetical protein [Aquimarina agarilytica]
MTYTTANTKQDFSINFENIVSSEELNSKQKILLMNILILHKVKCKRSFQHILNVDLAAKVGVTIPTLIKVRDSLEELNCFTVKIKYGTKSVEVSKEKRKNSPLYYYPNWKKLTDLGFIKKTTNLHKEAFKNKVKANQNVTKVKPKLPKNKPLTADIKHLIDDNEYYKVKAYAYIHGIRSVNGKDETMTGKSLKTVLNVNRNKRKYGDSDLVDYELI